MEAIGLLAAVLVTMLFGGTILVRNFVREAANRREAANLAYWNSFFDEVDEGIRRDNLLNLSAMTREERREALSKGEE